MKDLSSIPVQYLKGVGPARARLLANLGVTSVEDLLYLFPRRYEDRRKITPISRLISDGAQTVSGFVRAVGARKGFHRSRHLFEAVIEDDSGRIKCIWFNQSYLEKYLHVGMQLVLYGRVEVFKGHLQMVSPEYEVIDKQDAVLSTGRIVPVYPLTRGVSQRYLRRLVHSCLEECAGQLLDVIPDDIRSRQSLEPLSFCIRSIHFPEDDKAREAAERRVSFEEFFLFQISVILRRSVLSGRKGCPHVLPAQLLERFRRSLPFSLTDGQLAAIRDISADMIRPRPMLRLLQGDVGSGKTIVSFFGCLAAVTNGFQAAIMAPTEILAEQHFTNFSRYFSGGLFGDLRVVFLSSSRPKKERGELLKAIVEGKVDVVVGTHALIAQDVQFKSLSFVCVDEQHKFGVKQRAVLTAKGMPPDVLVMTATPIPRSLCLTLYGDLDVSVITHRPQGRGQTKTYRFADDQSDSVYQRVAEWVVKGTQAYIVYPIIEESETEDLKAATDMYQRFVSSDFSQLRVGLIHGRLKRDEAKEVMNRFKSQELDVLVTTTVLEVGIDVPNANVMVIENAHRFGLSQLHQLRGRIGRGEKNAVCILLSSASSVDAVRRLDAFVNTHDGFEIAREDLAIRGPGQYFGRQQHGLNDLKVVSPLTQLDLLETARTEAGDLLKTDAGLKKHSLILQTIRRRYPEYLERILAG
jgi:ATP-dependent DNA helicase RecG